MPAGVGRTTRVLPLKQHVASRAAARLLAGPVPAWAVAAAALSQVLLVGGWLVAGALQPVAYSPMQQTMSVLAGQTATDPWVMTAALFGVGSCQVAAGLGLTRAAAQARLLLILAGLSTIGVAASPDAAGGPTPWHLAFAVASIATTLVWPLFTVCRGPGQPWVLGVCCGLCVTVLFAALSGWLLVCTQGSGDLGLVERLTCSAQGVWPLVVAFALWQAESHPPIRQGCDLPREADTDLGATVAGRRAPGAVSGGALRWQGLLAGVQARRSHTGQSSARSRSYPYPQPARQRLGSPADWP